MERQDIQTLLTASGYRIPPYRLAHMAKSVSKIVEILTGNPVYGYTAIEAHYMLRVADSMISQGEEDVWN